jgi:hypothetical protein
LRAGNLVSRRTADPPPCDAGGLWVRVECVGTLRVLGDAGVVAGSALPPSMAGVGASCDEPESL